jgi:AP2-associated kinase
LKIENVLLENKKFKLCDFGSSSNQSLDFSKIKRNEYYIYEEIFEKNTTLMYRPPEMCDLYQQYIVNEKVDIWMLGCIVYTLCFYKHPFQDSSKLGIVNASYAVPSTHNYSEKLIDLMRNMLTPNPAFRPSVEDLIKVMDNYQNI